MRRLSTWTLTLSLLALGACAPPAPSGPAASPLRVGIAIPSYAHGVVWIGRDRGDFAAAGGAEVTVMGGSAATMRGLIAENIDIGVAGGDAVLKARAAGADLVVVGGLVDRFYHRIIGRAELKSMGELAGRKVGLPFLGGPQHTAVRYALREAELAEDKVELLGLGKEFNRMAALSRGDIDATTSQTPAARIRELGFTILADLPESGAKFPYAVIVVRRSFLERSHSRLVAFLRGLRAASDFYRRDEKASLALLSRELKGSDTAEAARERYASAGPGLISETLEPDREGFELVKSLTPALAGADLDSLFDLRALRASRGEDAGP